MPYPSLFGFFSKAASVVSNVSVSAPGSVQRTVWAAAANATQLVYRLVSSTGDGSGNTCMPNSEIEACGFQLGGGCTNPVQISSNTCGTDHTGDYYETLSRCAETLIPNATAEKCLEDIFNCCHYSEITLAETIMGYSLLGMVFLGCAFMLCKGPGSDSVESCSRSIKEYCKKEEAPREEAYRRM